MRVETREEYGSLRRVELTVLNIGLVANRKPCARQNFAELTVIKAAAGRSRNHQAASATHPQLQCRQDCSF
jgi:hypothetical protein